MKLNPDLTQYQKINSMNQRSIGKKKKYKALRSKHSGKFYGFLGDTEGTNNKRNR